MSNNKSLFGRLWHFITGGLFRKNEEEIHPRESLTSALERLDQQVDEAEEAFAHFLKNLRQSEAEHQDLVEAKDKWGLEIKSMADLHKKATKEDPESRRAARAYEALRHAVQQEVRTEKRVQSHSELLERQQDVKDQLLRSISKLKQHRTEFSNKLNELIARESLASTEKDLYSSGNDREHLLELEDFEREIRQNEYLAIGFKELNGELTDSVYGDDDDFGDNMEEEMRLLKELS